MRIVSPHSSELKSCGAREPGETFQRIFIREFCGDFFPRAKAEFMIGDVNSLINLTDEMHFDSGLRWNCRSHSAASGPNQSPLRVRGWRASVDSN